MKQVFILLLVTFCSHAASKDKIQVVMTGTSGDSEYDAKFQDIFSESYEFIHVLESEYTKPVPTKGGYPEPLLEVYAEEDGKLESRYATGEVIIYYVIGAGGKVLSARAKKVSGCDCLVSYLLDNVYKWEFHSAKLNGESVNSAAVQEFEY